MLAVVIVIFLILLIIGSIAKILEGLTTKGMKAIYDTVPQKIEAMVLLVSEASTIIKKYENREYVPDIGRTLRRLFTEEEIKPAWLEAWIRVPTIISIQPRYIVSSISFIGSTVRKELKEKGIASQISESSQLVSMGSFAIENKDGVPSSYICARLILVGQLVSIGSGPFVLVEE